MTKAYLRKILMRNYDDPQYKKWRKFIRKRDNSTCQWPNCYSRQKIHVHHIMPWSTFPSLRYDTNNGICLCKTHHSLIKNNEEAYCGFFYRVLSHKKLP